MMCPKVKSKANFVRVQNRFNTIVCLSAIGVILSVSFFVLVIPFISEAFRSPEDRIVSLYNACSKGYSARISKAGASGEQLSMGGEVLKTATNDAFYFKAYSDKYFSPTMCLDNDKNKHVYIPLSSEMTSYGSAYSKAIDGSDIPSEFHTFSIDEDLNGVVGIPIGANKFEYYAVFSSKLDKLTAAYNVCSVFYSKYGQWGKGDSDDGFPAAEDTAITSKQLRLSDGGKSLVFNIEPSDFSYPGSNNIGRCVRGMLDIPERIRKAFSDDWFDAKDSASRTYSWSDYKMDVRFTTRYSYDTEYQGKTIGNAEVIIYKQ